MNLKPFLALLTPVVPAILSAFGPVYPLTENSFSNPEFVERFRGSYGFDLERNPKITTEESELFQSIAPLMQSSPQAAIQQLQTYYDAAMADPEKDPSPVVLYTIGSLYLQGGDNAKADRYYTDAIKGFPNFFRAYQNLGLSEVQQGKYEAALGNLTKALEIGGGSGTLYGLMGYCYLNLENTSAALDSYRLAMLFQPKSRDWRLGKLSCLMRIGETKEAITLLDTLIAENPSEADFWMQQANAFMGQEAYLDAAANLELVTRLGKATPQSLVLLGDLYVNEGLFALGVDTYTKALASQKLGADRLLRIVENLSFRGAPDQASRFLERLQSEYADVLSESQSLLALNLQARLALAQGRQEEAVAILQKVVSRDPLNGKALLTLGDYYRDQGDLEKAEFQYDSASKVKATEVDALVALGRLKVSQREYRSAIEYLRRAQSLEPKPYVAEYIDRLEAALRSMGS